MSLVVPLTPIFAFKSARAVHDSHEIQVTKSGAGQSADRIVSGSIHRGLDRSHIGSRHEVVDGFCARHRVEMHQLLQVRVNRRNLAVLAYEPNFTHDVLDDVL